MALANVIQTASGRLDIAPEHTPEEFEVTGYVLVRNIRDNWDMWPAMKIYQLPIKELRKYDPIETFVDEDFRPNRRSWHIGRVRFFYEELMAGRMLDSIKIWGTNKLIISDGYHRVAAAILAHSYMIHAHYVGEQKMYDKLHISLTGTLPLDIDLDS